MYFNIFFHFMTDFELLDGDGHIQLHHSYTLHTNEPQDFEIQVDRPSLLNKFYMFFVNFGPLLWIHQSNLKDTFLSIKNNGKCTSNIKQCVPKEHHLKSFLKLMG